MAYTFGPNIQAYTDEMSFSLIGKAVLTTDLMDHVAVRTGLSAGTVAINLLDGDLRVNDRACGFTIDDTDPTQGGDINFTQVDIVIKDKQVKMEVCTQDLRQYYTSQYMSPSANAEDVPFEEIIADYYVQKIRAYNESFLINGDATADGIEAQIKAGSTNIPTGAAAWTVATALDEALDLYDAMDEAVKDRDDLILVCSPAAYRTLTRAILAGTSGDGLRHYSVGDGQGELFLPSTNMKVVKSQGLSGTNANFAFAGPGEFIIAGTGMSEDDSSFGMFYVPSEDIVKVRAYWRLGVAVAQVGLFAHNNL